MATGKLAETLDYVLGQATQKLAAGSDRAPAPAAPNGTAGDVLRKLAHAVRDLDGNAVTSRDFHVVKAAYDASGKSFETFGCDLETALRARFDELLGAKVAEDATPGDALRKLAAALPTIEDAQTLERSHQAVRLLKVAGGLSILRDKARGAR